MLIIAKCHCNRQETTRQHTTDPINGIKIHLLMQEEPGTGACFVSSSVNSTHVNVWQWRRPVANAPNVSTGLAGKQASEATVKLCCIST